MFNFINVELTSRCQKDCWCCGRRKLEREHPELIDWGDMPLMMVYDIAQQVPDDTVVQFHWNGEPLLYDQLGMALYPFARRCICQLDTNGKLLLDRIGEIMAYLDVITISVIENDPEGDDQYETVCEFLERKKTERPQVVYRLLGDVDRAERWYGLPGTVATRVLHAPEGSRDYEKKVTIPEIGICLDLLTHLAVDRYGNISMCVRFDPEGELRLGNIKDMTLKEAWHGEKRQGYIKEHVAGRRSECPGCASCDYWGVSIGQ